MRPTERGRCPNAAHHASEPPKLSEHSNSSQISGRNQRRSHAGVLKTRGGCCFGANHAGVCLHFSAPRPLSEIFSSPRRPAETAAVRVHLMCSSSTALGTEGEADHRERAAEDERGRENDGENKFQQLRFGLCCIIIRSCITIPSSLHRLWRRSQNLELRSCRWNDGRGGGLGGGHPVTARMIKIIAKAELSAV